MIYGMFPIILGSASPRRRELLGQFTLPFIPRSSTFDEGSVCFEGNPYDYVKQVATGKWQNLSKSYPSNLLITADSIVHLDGKIFHRPKTRLEAFETLASLSGRWHQVLTAICVGYGDQFLTQTEEARVLFHTVSPEQIQRYITHIETFDKAGGYTIQGKGSILIKKLEGCYTNVLGFPIGTLRSLLNQFGIDLWNYLG